jgi:hypothetical protein
MNQIRAFQVFAFLSLAHRVGARVYYRDDEIFVDSKRWPSQFATSIEFPGLEAEAYEGAVAEIVSDEVFGQPACVKGKPEKAVGMKPRGIGITELGRLCMLPPAAAPQIDAGQFGQPNGEA